MRSQFYNYGIENQDPSPLYPSQPERSQRSGFFCAIKRLPQTNLACSTQARTSVCARPTTSGARRPQRSTFFLFATCFQNHALPPCNVVPSLSSIALERDRATLLRDASGESGRWVALFQSSSKGPIAGSQIYLFVPCYILSTLD